MTCTIFVGAGIFGVTAALESRRSNPPSNVYLIDPGPSDTGNRQAASHDLCKIVRPDYGNPAYAALMQDAMRGWKNVEPYKSHYHEQGIIRLGAKETAHDYLESYRKLGTQTSAKVLDVEEARQKYEMLNGNMFGGVGELYWNPDAGYADGDVLNALRKEAVKHGVIYRRNTVKRLIMGSERCNGVKLGNDEILYGGKIVLCTGARTAWLLAESAPSSPEFHAGNRLTAAGAVSCTFRVLETEKMPVVKNALGHCAGEAIRMENRVVKANLDLAIPCFQRHSSGQSISVPRDHFNESNWCTELPDSLKERCLDVVRNILSENVPASEVKFRVCWDAVTENHDFLISPHPMPGLFVAGGGSFHAFKFAPILGKMICHMLDGELDHNLAELFSWNTSLRQQGKLANPTYQIGQDWEDWEEPGW